MIFKKIENYLRSSFFFSIREAKSTVIFMVLLIFVWFLVWIQGIFFQGKIADIVIKEYGDALLDPDIEYKNSYSGQYFSKDQKGSSFRPFAEFNPNSDSFEALKDAGMPPYIAKIMINYRSKGGVFKYKEDLLRIYGIKQELFEKMHPFINLPSKGVSEYSFDDHRVPERAKEIVVGEQKEIKPKQLNFDLNTADTIQLKSVYGIGSTYAQRIIKFRDALGGFNSMEQVLETFGLNPEVLPELKKRAFLGKSSTKIDINHVESFKHPYLKQSKVKVILKYRTEHGPFKSVEDLSKIYILTPDEISKIAPYLMFN